MGNDKKWTAASGNEYYLSSRNKDYDKSTAQIKFRIRPQDRESLNEYLRRMQQEEPENPKYKNLNTFLINLVRAETGLDIKAPKVTKS